MNTIRRARRRPRRRSFNFRSFFWILTREAAFRILANTSLMRERDADIRYYLSKETRDRVIARASRHLEEFNRQRCDL